MIDSHCHLDADPFAADRAAVLARALERGVEDIVVPAVGRESWDAILSLSAAGGAPRCHAALGLHPVALPAAPPADDDRTLDELAARARQGGLVAVGECGLDALVDLERAPFARQERLLLAQLDLARELDLPVILHARGALAYRRLAELLERDALPAAGGVVHSYGGGAELLGRLSHERLYFGFAGPATYPDARKVRASVQAVRRDRLLAETDAPDQTPAPHRPARNEPAYLADVVAGIARSRDEPAAAMAELTTENARRLFRLAPNELASASPVPPC